MPEQTIEMVSQLTQALGSLPVHPYSGKKVVLTGITCELDDILKYFDQCGVAVVGDDLAQESRQYRTDYPAANSAIERLALHWFEIKGCSTAHDDNNTARGDMDVLNLVQRLDTQWSKKAIQTIEMHYADIGCVSTAEEEKPRQELLA